MNLGFDQTFMDTIIYLFDENNTLLQKIPPTGHHVRNSRVDQIAGGNGVNVSYTLKKLGIANRLVVPSDEQFDKLLKDRGMETHYRITNDINTTYALICQEGEIQINHVNSSLGREQWTDMVDTLWRESELKIFLNWGLNEKSHEWVYCQWLATCDVEYEELININTDDFFSYEPKYPCIIDPGSIINHRHGERLLSYLEYMMSFDNCTLLCNEEEAAEFVEIGGKKIIHHKNKVVIIDADDEITLNVPPLECIDPVFVGAGDAFLAGVIQSIVTGERNILIMTKNGIKVSQKYICDDL